MYTVKVERPSGVVLFLHTRSREAMNVAAVRETDVHGSTILGCFFPGEARS
jgi:hypothetical protein